MGPSAAARAADRLLERGRRVALEPAPRAGLAGADGAGVGAGPRNREVTLVFTDLVGFSEWSLRVGDDATLRLLRRVSQEVEPPLLEAGGHIVKRMGDGIMAVFADASTAVRAAIAAREGRKAPDVDGYTPRMRVGVHTGRPAAYRIGLGSASTSTSRRG